MGKDDGYQRQVDIQIPARANSNIDISAVTTTSGAIKKKYFGDGFKVIVVGCILFACTLTIGLVVDIYTRKATPKGYTVITDAFECTQIANTILDEEGSAVDASIAALFCLAVVRPDQISLAGGGVMLVHNKGIDSTINFQYKSPNLTVSPYKNSSHVAVPGFLRGLKLAHDSYGTISWSKLISPSVALAKDGFKISNTTAFHIKSLLPTLSRDIISMLSVNGSAVQAGDHLKLPTLSDTLKRAMDSVFVIEQDIINTVTENNGTILPNDLTSYKPSVIGVIKTKFKGTTLVSSPLPSSGVLVLSALNILGELPKKNINITYQYLVEALKVVLHKAKLVQESSSEKRKMIVNELLSSEFARNQSNEIENKLHENDPVVYVYKRFEKSSADVIVVDRYGTKVSTSCSLGHIYGSKIMTKSGVILNNGLDDELGKPQSLKPGESPLEFTAPLFAYPKKENKKGQTFSTSSGRNGIASLTQVMYNIYGLKMKYNEAISRPRVLPDILTEHVVAEGKRFQNAGLTTVISYLDHSYKNFVADAKSIGNVMMVSNKQNAFSDPRTT